MSDGSSIRRPALGEPSPPGRQEAGANERCTDIDGLTPEQIVEKYTRLVDFWVHRTRHWDRGLPKEDRYQEGMIGLLEAAKRFDPARGVRFSTYAGYWVHAHITKAAHWTCSTIRIPDWLWKTGGRPPAVTSLSKPMDGNEASTLADTVAAPEPESAIEARETALQQRRDVDLLLGRLHPRDRICVWDRVALGVQLHRVADSLGISGERVRQLVARAMKQLGGQEPKRRRSLAASSPAA